MENRDDDNLVQEVDELTEMFRFDEDWENLREIVARQNLDSRDILLAGYYEGEEGEEYACFVTFSGKVIEYEGRVGVSPKPPPVIWRERTMDQSIVDAFAAVEVAMKMVTGEIQSRWTGSS